MFFLFPNPMAAPVREVRAILHFERMSLSETVVQVVTQVDADRVELAAATLQLSSRVTALLLTKQTIRLQKYCPESELVKVCWMCRTVQTKFLNESLRV